jgi:creatinine amidohydrolase
MGNVMLDSAAATWMDIDRARDGLVAVLPVGALEQHGPHLPLDTDTVLATGVARRIAERVGSWLLPAVGFGEAWTAEDWPGTISLGAETLQAVIADIGRGAGRIGCRGLVTVNGHFGNRAPIAGAASMLRNGGLAVLELDYPGLEAAALEYCASKPAGPGFYHADEVETSMMLALAPASVRMELASAEYPRFPADFGKTPMQLRSFNRSGVFGDPRAATAATGEKIIGRIVDASVRLVAEWSAVP